jgi:hypothetical protein
MTAGWRGRGRHRRRAARSGAAPGVKIFRFDTEMPARASARATSQDAGPLRGIAAGQETYRQPARARAQRCAVLDERIALSEMARVSLVSAARELRAALCAGIARWCSVEPPHYTRSAGQDVFFVAEVAPLTERNQIIQAFTTDSADRSNVNYSYGDAKCPNSVLSHYLVPKSI